MIDKVADLAIRATEKIVAMTEETEKAAEEAVTWAEVVTEMDRAKVTKAKITKKVTRAEMLINLPKKTNDRLLN